MASHQTTPETIPAGDLSSSHAPEWHERRRTGIGGSDLWPLVSGEALRIYHEKTRPYEEGDDLEMNTDLLRGRLLEDVFADLWSKSSGRKIRRLKSVRHKVYPWAVVNVDRQVTSQPGKPTALLEVKSPRSWVYRNILEGGYRDRTALQIQHGLFVTGYEEAFYVAGNLESTPPLVTFSIAKDDDLITTLRQLEERFWTEHVLAFQPPDPDEWNSLGLEVTTLLPKLEIQPVSYRDTEIETSASNYAGYRGVASGAKKGQAVEKEVLVELMTGLGYQEIISGRWKVTYKKPKDKETFDEEELARHRPIDRDAFIRWYGEEHPCPAGCDPTFAADELRLNLDRFTTTTESNPVLNVRDLEGKN